MNPRNIKYLFLALPFLAACDDIAEEDRLTGPIEFTPMKNVLVEDFTGQRCVNCPRAAEALKAIQKTYGAEHVISVAIHGGGNTNSFPVPYGLANSEGEDYISHWGIVQLGFPKGIVDRTNDILNYPAWSARVVERLQMVPKVELSAQAVSNAEEGRIDITVEVEATNKEAVNGNLQVWLVESHILGYQSMPGGQPADLKYEHNHVFRASVNGAWGEHVVVPASGILSQTFSYEPQDYWKVENMSVIAFVYNDAEGVLQVTETKMETNN